MTIFSRFEAENMSRRSLSMDGRQISPHLSCRRSWTSDGRARRGEQGPSGAAAEAIEAASAAESRSREIHGYSGNAHAHALRNRQAGPHGVYDEMTGEGRTRCR